MCIRAPWRQLNRISHSGLLIIDNEGIQGGKLTTNTTFKFNWVFDAGGLGLRFDTGEEGLFGSNNNLQFNVVFRNSQGGLSGKSDNASNYRNTGTDNQGGTDVEAGGFTGGAVDMKICHCYPASCEGERSSVPVPAFTNRDSVTRGNVGIMGPGTAGGLLNQYDLPGAHDHNLNLALARGGTLHIDDGRPVPGLIDRTVDIRRACRACRHRCTSTSSRTATTTGNRTQRASAPAAF